MNDTDSIIALLQTQALGLTLAELERRQPAMARRTLQRRLSELVEQGKILAQGKARARRYFYIPPSRAYGINEDNAPYSSIAVPWSVDSQDALAYIAKPISARKPVGYQYEFLQDYQPNKSFYLPASLRSQLRHIGTFAQPAEPAGTYNRTILSRLRIDLSWASSHLEGNTYSRLDTLKLIEQGTAAEGKALLETQMILNHKNAIELLAENSLETGFNRYTLMNLHSALAENLLPNADDEGHIREHAVDISQSVYRPLDNAHPLGLVLDEMLNKASQIQDPFEQSFFMMVHLPYLQPFADINKRTSRLAANMPLFRHGLCPLTFLGVPQAAYTQAILSLYEMTRIEPMRDLYLWAYERSAQEYQSIRQILVEPDALRLKWRELIKEVVCQVVRTPQADSLEIIQTNMAQLAPTTEREEIKALVIAELRRLHEGTLARYGLRPAEFYAWRQRS
ncbi:MAG: Fic family protein [Venatoribacter sp.]